MDGWMDKEIFLVRFVEKHCATRVGNITFWFQQSLHS